MAGDEARGGLRFVETSDSSNQCPMLLVPNEESNTLTIWQPSFY